MDNNIEKTNTCTEKGNDERIENIKRLARLQKFLQSFQVELPDKKEPFEIKLDRYDELIKKEAMLDAIVRFLTSQTYVPIDIAAFVGAVCDIDWRARKNEPKS